MTMIAALSCALGAAAFVALLVLLRSVTRGNPVATRLTLACSASAAWLALQGGVYRFNGASLLLVNLVLLAELLRDACWVWFFARLLDGAGDAGYRRGLRIGVNGLMLTAVACALVAALATPGAPAVGLEQADLRKLFYCLMLLVPLGALVLVEQVFRNTARESRWALKHLCFGVGFLFIYDFYLYADAAMFNRIDVVLWSVR